MMKIPSIQPALFWTASLSLAYVFSGCGTAQEETPQSETPTDPPAQESPTAATATPSSSSWDLTHLRVGDETNILLANEGKQPAAGALLLCGLPPDGAGAAPSDDWMNSDGTWDYTRKPRVPGAIVWESEFDMTLLDTYRIITGNGLPTTPTGIFPIPSDSVAYQYDRNPSHIEAQDVDLTFEANPTYHAQPYCMPYGANGIALTGSAIYHGASTLGTDAAAYEMLDDCGGHSDGTGTYHYHMLTECMLNRLDAEPTGHSSLMGFMMDGFGLYGPRGEDGQEVTQDQLDECHGHTHTVDWDDKPVDIYHYHWGFDFPYNIGCMRGTPVTPWNGKDNKAHVHPH